ncbi:MAG: AI-2E family transporter [Armatimonadetes bacterium]|nr:AI-2E family transporter [Armatimonadota bacterium]
MTTTALVVAVVGLLIAFAFTATPAANMARVRRFMATGLGLILLLAAVHHFRAILPPFVVPLILAYLLDPILDRLEHEGFSRVRAILLVYVVVMLLLGVATVVVVPPLTKQVGDLVSPIMAEGGIDVETIQGMIENQEKLRKGLSKTLLSAGVPAAWVERLEDNYAQLRINERLQSALRWIAEQLQRTAMWLAGQVSGLLWLLLLPITLYYFMRDFDPLRRRLYFLVPPDKRIAVAGLAGSINDALGRYLRGYALLSLMVGIVLTTILLILTPIFDFKYGLFLGLLAGSTYFIPYIGSFTSVLLAVLAIYFTGGHSLVEAGVAWLILQGVNSLFDNVISPRVIGGSVGLHPLLVMFALLAGGADFGLLGVILATPVAVCIKIVLEYFVPRLAAPIPADETPEAVLPRVSPEGEGEPPAPQPSEDIDVGLDATMVELPEGKDSE